MLTKRTKIRGVSAKMPNLAHVRYICATALLFTNCFAWVPVYGQNVSCKSERLEVATQLEEKLSQSNTVYKVQIAQIEEQQVSDSNIGPTFTCSAIAFVWANADSVPYKVYVLYSVAEMPPDMLTHEPAPAGITVAVVGIMEWKRIK